MLSDPIVLCFSLRWSVVFLRTEPVLLAGKASFVYGTASTALCSIPSCCKRATSEEMTFAVSLCSTFSNEAIASRGQFHFKRDQHLSDHRNNNASAAPQHLHTLHRARQASAKIRSHEDDATTYRMVTAVVRRV